MSDSKKKKVVTFFFSTSLRLCRVLRVENAEINFLWSLSFAKKWLKQKINEKLKKKKKKMHKKLAMPSNNDDNDEKFSLWLSF